MKVESRSMRRSEDAVWKLWADVTVVLSILVPTPHGLQKRRDRKHLCYKEDFLDWLHGMCSAAQQLSVH